MACLVIGAVLSLVAGLVVLLMKGHTNDFGFMGGTLIVSIGCISLIVGFVLFTTGWLSYFRKKIGMLLSVGWWGILAGAWSEVFLLSFWMVWVSCYHSMSGAEWCERDHHLVPYFSIPAAIMLFGLIMVYIGKKHKKVQSGNSLDQPSGGR
jgi:hypothetical protein